MSANRPDAPHRSSTSRCRSSSSAMTAYVLLRFSYDSLPPLQLLVPVPLAGAGGRRVRGGPPGAGGGAARPARQADGRDRRSPAASRSARRPRWWVAAWPGPRSACCARVLPGRRARARGGPRRPRRACCCWRSIAARGGRTAARAGRASTRTAAIRRSGARTSEEPASGSAGQVRGVYDGARATPRRPAAHPAVVLRAIGFGVAVALGAVAVWLIVTGTDQKRIEIGVLAGLWGVLLGAYSMFGSRRAGRGRRPAHRRCPSAEPLRDRAAVGRRGRAHRRGRRAHAPSRSGWRRCCAARSGSAMSREVAGLRAEVAPLRNELVEKVGGQLRLERIETTRLIGSDLEALQHEVRQLKAASESGTLMAEPGLGERSVHRVVDSAGARRRSRRSPRLAAAEPAEGRPARAAGGSRPRSQRPDKSARAGAQSAPRPSVCRPPSVPRPTASPPSARTPSGRTPSGPRRAAETEQPRRAARRRRRERADKAAARSERERRTRLRREQAAAPTRLPPKPSAVLPTRLPPTRPPRRRPRPRGLRAERAAAERAERCGAAA